MKVENTPDFSVTDEACQQATGKSYQQWFAELDGIDGLKVGRRESIRYVYDQTKDFWWPTTIYVQYEAHHNIKKKDGLADGYAICCTKSIAAPVERVYSVWTDPMSFAEMFGDGGTQDLVEGGAIGCKAGCKGTFTRIRTNKDLRFTWEHPGCTAPMVVDVQFQDNKGKCLMNVMTSRIQTREEADGLRNAWSDALSRLKSLSEA